MGLEDLSLNLIVLPIWTYRLKNDLRYDINKSVREIVKHKELMKSNKMLQSARGSENEVECQSSPIRIYRASHLNTSVVNIYLWITVIALCCYQTCSLPPIIRIGL